jgi:hypothetical protein
LYICYSAFDRPNEATNAPARHELVWSSRGETSPFLDDGAERKPNSEEHLDRRALAK